MSIRERKNENVGFFSSASFSLPPPHPLSFPLFTPFPESSSLLICLKKNINFESNPTTLESDFLFSAGVRLPSPFIEFGFFDNMSDFLWFPYHSYLPAAITFVSDIIPRLRLIHGHYPQCHLGPTQPRRLSCVSVFLPGSLSRCLHRLDDCQHSSPPPSLIVLPRPPLEPPPSSFRAFLLPFHRPSTFHCPDLFLRYQHRPSSSSIATSPFGSIVSNPSPHWHSCDSPLSSLLHASDPSHLCHSTHSPNYFFYCC